MTAGSRALRCDGAVATPAVEASSCPALLVARSRGGARGESILPGRSERSRSANSLLDVPRAGARGQRVACPDRRRSNTGQVLEAAGVAAATRRRGAIAVRVVDATTEWECLGGKSEHDLQHVSDDSAGGGRRPETAAVARSPQGRGRRRATLHPMADRPPGNMGAATSPGRIVLVDGPSGGK